MKQGNRGAQLPKIRYDAPIRQQSQIELLEPRFQPVDFVVGGQRSQYAPTLRAFAALIGRRLGAAKANQFWCKLERVSKLPAGR